MCPLDPALLAPPYKHFRVSPALADDYMHLFVNRPEYSIQAAQPMMNGKVGWYLARDRNTREAEAAGQCHCPCSYQRRAHHQSLFDRSGDAALEVGGDRRGL